MSSLITEYGLKCIDILDENKIKFITDMMLKYQIDKIAKQKMDIYFDEGMKILSSISSKKNKILELKNYFEKMRERKF